MREAPLLPIASGFSHAVVGGPASAEAQLSMLTLTSPSIVLDWGFATSGPRCFKGQCTAVESLARLEGSEAIWSIPYRL